MSEAVFIQDLKQGRSGTYEALVKQFASKVYNTCLGMIQNEEDAEDVTQEVFIEVFQSVKEFNEASSLSTWIYRISVSKSLEFLRKKRAQKRFAFVIGLFGKEDRIHRSDNSPFYHPGVQLENKERAAILFKAIDQLAENQRAAFILHKTEGLSYAEIAEVLEVSVSSVESLMVRARQNLQKLLGDYYEKNEK